MYLVVDTWVWKKAQRAESFSALEVIAKILRKCHKIVCDYDMEIEDEYWRHIKELKAYFVRMSQMGKVEKRPRIKINLEELDDFEFDKDDIKFIEVAISVNALVVSGESDFLELRKRLHNDSALKARFRNIEILTPDEALARI